MTRRSGSLPALPPSRAARVSNFSPVALWLLSAVTLLVLSGLVAAAASGSAPGLAPESTAGPDEPSRPTLATPFGVITVDDVQVVAPPPREQARGLHGPEVLVGPGQVQVRMSLELVNQSERAAPAQLDHLALRSAGSDELVPPTGSTFASNLVPPGAALRGQLLFSVPADGARLLLIRQPPGDEPATEVAVGHARATADEAREQDAHGSSATDTHTHDASREGGTP